MTPAPDEQDRRGALSHDPPCPWCGHGAHRYLPCGDRCDCTHAEQIGVDTALGG